MSMASEKHLSLLKEGPDEWNKSRAHQNIETPNLRGANLQKAHLQRAHLENADLRGADLKGANLEGANLRGANLQGAVLRMARLQAANLQDANLQDAQPERARLQGANLEGANLQGTNLECAKLQAANLQDANFEDANLEGANLEGANLEGANLRGARLNNSLWADARLVKTDLGDIRFKPGHPALYDGTKRLRFHWRDGLNWSRLRNIGRFPFFGVSWMALTISLLVVNIIGFLNSEATADIPIIKGLTYPIPIPKRMMLILFDSCVLVLGSSLYRAACPIRVQEFSEVSWVEEHGHPRLQYLSESLKRRFQVVTALSILAGGALALFLVGERLLQAVWYIWEALQSQG